jgi:hypothetical protein
MTRLKIFMSMIIVFSVSYASANQAVRHLLDDKTTALIVVCNDGVAEVSDERALLSALPILDAPQPVPVDTMFVPPKEKKKFVSPIKSLPLIGKGNINCYGGTAAKFARG